MKDFGSLGADMNRGVRATARFEHIWKIAKLSFVSTMPRNYGADIDENASWI
jgi:hypothetical protein